MRRINECDAPPYTPFSDRLTALSFLYRPETTRCPLLLSSVDLCQKPMRCERELSFNKNGGRLDGRGELTNSCQGKTGPHSSNPAFSFYLWALWWGRVSTAKAVRSGHIYKKLGNTDHGRPRRPGNNFGENDVARTKVNGLVFHSLRGGG